MYVEKLKVCVEYRERKPKQYPFTAFPDLYRPTGKYLAPTSTLFHF